MSFVRRREATVRPSVQTSICDYCRHMFDAAELEWIVEDWICVDGRRGHLTATLCKACSGLALEHCWRCGQLTGRKDGVCWRCAR